MTKEQIKFILDTYKDNGNDLTSRLFKQRFGKPLSPTTLYRIVLENGGRLHTVNEAMEIKKRNISKALTGRLKKDKVYFR